MQGAGLRDLIVAVGGRPVGISRAEALIRQVQIDSRQVQPGDVFFALPGLSHDGHQFVDDAAARGAVCCVVREGAGFADHVPRVEVGDTQRALEAFAVSRRVASDALVIGVTGSNGKTTTRSMLHAVLSSRFAGTQSPRNLNNHVGVPLSLLEIEPRHEYAVIEFGASHVGEIAALAKMAQPEAAVITSIAPAHLADFGSIEHIAVAKGELVEAIPSLGFVALNGDDERVLELASRSACRVITFGEGSDCDVRGRGVCVANDRITFEVDGAPFSLRAIGRHHLTAALACVAVGRELGLSDQEIAAGLTRFEAVGGRCHGRRIGPWTVIDDTYNANPASMLAGCHVLRDWQGARNRWLVLGDMLSLGPNSAAFHRELGRSAAEAGIDGVAALGTFADDVIAAAAAHGMSSGQLGTFRNAETLMATLDCWLETDDVVLVKGSRGMQMEQIVAALNQLAARRVSHQEIRQAA